MTAQLTVTLDRRLIASLKRRALDSDLSLSELVARICSGYLGEWWLELPETDDVTSDVPASNEGHEPGELDVVLQPMVHVADLAGTVTLLEALGGEVVQESRDGDWLQVAIGGAEIGLLAHPPNPEQGEGGAVELNFESRTPLERVEQSAHDAGVQIARPTSDEAFGRQLQLRTPDGLLVKLFEIDGELIG